MTRTRATQLRALTPALLRAVRWQPMPAAAIASVLLLWWQHDRTVDPTGAVWMLRAVGLVLAAGMAFALDDRTRPTMAAVPTPLWWRAAVQLIGVAAPAALAWCAALVWMERRVDGAVPAAGLSLEAMTLAAVVLAVAGGLARWRGITDPGTVTAPAMLALGLLLPQLPGRVALVILPGPGWDSAHVRWALLLAVAFAALTLSLRDPAASRPRPWGSRPSS